MSVGTTEQRLVDVPLKATAGEKGLWTRAAEVQGMRRDHWIRWALNAEANATVERPATPMFPDEAA